MTDFDVSYLFPPTIDLEDYDFEGCYESVKEKCWDLISNESIDISFDCVEDAVKLHLEKNNGRYSSFIHHKETYEIAKIMLKLLYKDLEDG